MIGLHWRFWLFAGAQCGDACLLCRIHIILPALRRLARKALCSGDKARRFKRECPVRSAIRFYYTDGSISARHWALRASWAHLHLGVENVYRWLRSCVRDVLAVLFFFRSAKGLGRAPHPRCYRSANFCVVLAITGLYYRYGNRSTAGIAVIVFPTFECLVLSGLRLFFVLDGIAGS